MKHQKLDLAVSIFALITIGVASAVLVTYFTGT